MQYEATLTNIVLEIWKKYANDHIITSFVLDLFEDFSKSQQYFPALASRALPFIDQVLKTAADSPLVLAVSDQLSLFPKCKNLTDHINSRLSIF